jgi:hypothetical protein
MFSSNPLSIDYLETLPERKRDEIIRENTDTSRPIHLSIIPAAHYFGMWPHADVFWHYLPEIFIVYPVFFHRADADWVEYGTELADGRCMAKILAPFYSVIRALAFETPDSHGPAFLYAAKILEKADDAVEWLGLHGKDLYKRYEVDVIGYLTHSYSQAVQIALIKTARLSEYRLVAIENMIETGFITDKDGNNNVFTVFPLEDDEKAYLRVRLPSLDSRAQDLVKDFL